MSSPLQRLGLLLAEACPRRSEVVGALREHIESEGLALRVHPYGFLHSALRRETDGSSLRLHIWARTPTVRELPIRVHAHAWSARSFVVAGRLTNEFYDVVPSREGNRSFSVSYRGEKSVRTPTEDTVSARLTHSETYTAGDVYVLPHGTYHQTVVAPDDFTCTLFTTSGTVSDPHVVGLPGEDHEEEFHREGVEDGVAREALDELYALTDEGDR